MLPGAKSGPAAVMLATRNHYRILLRENIQIR